MKIIWSAKALQNLECIYDFYAIESETAANKIVSDILSRTRQLTNFPLSGQIQQFRKKTRIRYRYLVEGNYKIFYSVRKSVIFIEVIFDTRQNPEKLK